MYKDSRHEKSLKELMVVLRPIQTRLKRKYGAAQFSKWNIEWRERNTGFDI